MSRLLDTIQGKPVDRPPIWMMRQAGRYLPEFREKRAKNPDFMSFCHDIDAVVDVTLQPLKRFDLDAAIIFSDILTIPFAMNHDVRFLPNQGPVLTPTLSSGNTLSPLNGHRLQFVMDGIQATRQALPDQIPLIGFSATPWTLLCYLMEGQGSKQGFHAAPYALKHATSWLRSTAHTLNQYIEDYLLRQIDAGADVIMLFDSWAGLVSESLYTEIFLPLHADLIASIHRHTQTPVILFAKDDPIPPWELIHTEADVLSVGHQHSIPKLCQQYPHVTWQGNLNPELLFSQPQDLDPIIDAMLPQKPARYIANLSHGIRPKTPIQNVQYWINRVTHHTYHEFL